MKEQKLNEVQKLSDITYNKCFTPMSPSVKHPAKYTDSFIPKFSELLKYCSNVLDPFGGVGKLALIKDYGFSGKVVCNEIEHEWVNTSEYDVDEWCIGDAANL